MTNWILKEIISSQYNNEKSTRCTNKACHFILARKKLLVALDSTAQAHSNDIKIKKIGSC